MREPLDLSVLRLVSFFVCAIIVLCLYGSRGPEDEAQEGGE